MAGRSSTRRIDLSELRKLACSGKLRKAQRARYFLEDVDKGRPFSPAIRVNPETVNLHGERLSSAEAVVLLNEAVTSTAATARAAARPRLRIYSEGDSWFNLPDFLPWYPPDCIDILDRTFEARRNTTAIWGDTLKNMVAGKQYLQKLGSGNFHHFLISGGGNDVLQDIGKHVLPRRTGDTDPGNAANYVKSSFDDVVGKLTRYYRAIHRDVTTRIPVEVVMFVHGYGNCHPLPDGKYLGKPLKKLGFDPAIHEAFARAIVAELLRRFNKALAAFAASHARVVYLDMRPLLTAASDWNFDEIHPSGAGATKVAGAFKTAIQAHTVVA